MLCKRSPRIAALSVVSFALCHAAVASDRLVLSLSGDGSLGAATIEDEELFLADSAGAREMIADQSLAFYFGDLNGDGTYDEPNDIDGLDVHPMPFGTPALSGYFLSLLADQGGIADGDIFRFHAGAPNGIEVLFDEATLIAATQANDGNIDVDAFAIADDGALYFSLAEDEATGPSGVVVEDEVIFVLAAGAATAQVLYDKAALEAMVSQALGATTSIGDVKGLDLFEGELLFSVQSPSSDDASVFTTAGGGAIHYAEATLGFANQVELDALAVLTGATFPGVALDAPVAPEGSPISLRVTGVAPGQPFVALLSGNTIPGGSGVAAGGFGAMVLDPTDPVFQVAASNTALLSGVAGADGVGVLTGPAPGTGGSPIDVAIQVLDAAGRLSAPVVLEVNQ